MIPASCSPTSPQATHWLSIQDQSSVSQFNHRVRSNDAVRLHCLKSDLLVAQSQQTTEPYNPTTSQTIPTTTVTKLDTTAAAAATTFISPLTTTDRPLAWNPVGVTVASGAGSSSTLNPFGVFVDDNYFIYVAEKANNRISKWPPNPSGGVTSPLYRSNTGELTGPPSLYADSTTGDIYVADEGASRVRVFRNGSTVGVTIPSPAVGSPAIVNALYLDPNRTIFIGDSANHRVYNWLTNQNVAGGNGIGSNQCFIQDFFSGRAIGNCGGANDTCRGSEPYSPQHQDHELRGGELDPRGSAAPPGTPLDKTLDRMPINSARRNVSSSTKTSHSTCPILAISAYKNGCPAPRSVRR